MQSTNIPTKIPIPFANSASSTYKTTIPQASQIGIANGRASLTDGFPPLTFQGISSGGIPPFGADFNGILYEITSITQWQQAGGMFLYDSSFSTTISGYPRGSVLQSSSLNGLWISSAENNTTNPDTGGAGWSSLAFEGSQSISVTSADVTLTQLQSAYPILIISGAQTAARNLIFPAIVGDWIVQNNTTGAFTLTAKTASGTGVTLTQGQSTYVYGDGTNIYFADSAKVASFNGRVGTVTLNATDVTTALGYTPVNKAGDTMSGALTNSSGFIGPLFGTLTGAWAYMPAGTTAVFYQASAPTGWTQVTTSDDAALRVVSGTGGTTGGTVGFTTAFASQAVSGSVSISQATGTVGGTALSIAQLPAHNHSASDSGHAHSISPGVASFNSAAGGGGGGNVQTQSNVTGTQIAYANISIGNTGSGATHTHSLTMDAQSGTFSGTAINLAVKYINTIICSKS